MSTYKTNHPYVIAAQKEYKEKKEDLMRRGKKFAEVFGGTPHFRYSIHGAEFGGVRFNPEMPQPLWTKPDRDTKGQRPRNSMKKSTPEEREQLKELNVKWHSKYKELDLNDDASLDPFFKSMGTDWGDILFSGISYFTFDGHVYVETGISLNDKMIEILGSEYAEAKASYKKQENN